MNGGSRRRAACSAARTTIADPALPAGPAPRERLLVALFFILWLVPVLWHGAVSKRWLPGEPALLLGLALYLALYLAARFSHAEEWLTALGFHPSPAADPANVSTVPLLPATMTTGLGIVTFAALGLAIFGRMRRLALGVTLAAVLYVSLVDPISAFTLNRLYIFTLVFLILAPTGANISAWPVRMLQWSLLTHYFASGLCKALHGDWLKYQDVLWMQIQGLYMTDAAAWLVRTLPHWAFPAQQPWRSDSSCWRRSCSACGDYARSASASGAACTWSWRSRCIS